MNNKEIMIFKLVDDNEVLLENWQCDEGQKWSGERTVYYLNQKNDVELLAKKLEESIKYFSDKKSYEYDFKSVDNKNIFKDELKMVEIEKSIIDILMLEEAKKTDPEYAKKSDFEKDLEKNKKKKSSAIKITAMCLAALLPLYTGLYVLERIFKGKKVGESNYNGDDKKNERIEDFNAIYEEEKTKNKLFDLTIKSDLERKLTDFTLYVNKISGVKYTTDECMKILLWVNEIHNNLDINYDEEVIERFSQIAEANHFDIVQHRIMGKKLEQSYFERTPEHLVSDPEGNAFLTVLFNKINAYVEAEYNHNHEDSIELARETFKFIVDTYACFEPTNTTIGKVKPGSIPNSAKLMGITEAYAALTSLQSILGLDHSVEVEMSDGNGGIKKEQISIQDMDQILNDQLQKLDLRFDPADKDNIDIIIDGDEENKIDGDTVFKYLSQDGRELKTVYIPRELSTGKQLVRTL
ncbi:MAG: hypothetical protein PHS45_00530 [Bacilli bacterium]|nr:hypothetical protein [Bacilli bacterium]